MSSIKVVKGFDMSNRSTILDDRKKRDRAGPFPTTRRCLGTHGLRLRRRRDTPDRGVGRPELDARRRGIANVDVNDAS
jgi:hypothetical protein